MNDNERVLSKEEIKVLYERMKAGDKEVRSKLIEHNFRLVTYVAHQYWNKEEVELGDLIGTGCIGLIKGIDTYDISRGTSLSTYLVKCITIEILLFFRKRNRYKELSLNRSLKDDKNVSFEDMLVDDSNEELYHDYLVELRKEYVNKLMTKLNPKEKIIMSMIYGLNGKPMTHKQVGKELGYCRTNITRTHLKILNKLRRYASKEELLDYIS